MQRSLILFFLGAMLLLVPSVFADGSWSFELVAGQHTPIGLVNVSIVGANLTATYQVTAAGWCMTTTHFYAGNTAPSNAPGQFNYKHAGLDCVTTDTFSVSTPTGDVFVAAHADSHFYPDNAAEPSDPLTGTATIIPTTGGSAYFNVQATGGVNGTFPAWCVDLDHFITPCTTYTANVHEDGAGLVDFPENLDLVNYVMNKDYSAWGASVMDIQTAIWLLIDDTVPVMISTVARDIEADARANGEGFVAGCGGVVGVLVEPIENNAQHLILAYPAPCPVEGNPRSETAWALGSWGVEFGQGWGMYFMLVDGQDAPPPANEEPTDEPTSPPIVDNGNGNGNGNNSRRDESPGYGGAEEPPRSRSDESNGGGNGGDNGDRGGNGNGNGNGRGN
jgi:hypothetical protein